ncbi:MAG: hypothetical protein ACP5GX_09710, partial [Anaerolineae bacterium]
MTTYSVLDQVGVSLDKLGALGGNERSRLLNFLLRWEQIPALQACLDVLIPCNPSLVSLMDLRVKALMAEERLDEALALMQKRLERRTSLTA